MKDTIKLLLNPWWDSNSIHIKPIEIEKYYRSEDNAYTILVETNKNIWYVVETPEKISYLISRLEEVIT